MEVTRLSGEIPVSVPPTPAPRDAHNFDPVHTAWEEGVPANAEGGKVDWGVRVLQ